MSPTDCTENCRAQVDCRVCKRRKAPHGRSVAPAMAGGLCDPDCAGYFNDPKPPHLWPGEEFPERTWTDARTPADTSEKGGG